MEYKKYEFDTYNIYTIKTDKFKNCHLEICFYDNVDVGVLAKRNFLTDMLVQSSLKYPKRKDIVIKLEELYQSFLYATTTKVGNMVLSSFMYDFLNPYYVNDPSYLKNTLKFPFEIIENPNVINNEFDERTFKIIKKRILADIDSINERPTNYALKRALNLMDENSITSKSVLGTKEEIEAITPEELYRYYQTFFEKSKCNIYVIGDLDMDKVVKIITESFQNLCIKNHEVKPYLTNIVRKKPLKTEEESSFGQSTLILGYNIVNIKPTERHAMLTLFNEVLCAGGLKSKIVNKLREENGLCYSVSPILSKYDNMYYICVSLDKKNTSLAIKLIKEAFKEMENGKIDEQDLESFKKGLYNSLNIVLDNESSILNNYTFNTITGTPLLSEFKEMYKNITIDDLKKLAKKFKLNFIYELSGKE